jgi:hypothetical protein
LFSLRITAYNLCKFFNLDRKYREDKIRVILEVPDQEFYPERDLETIQRVLEKYGVYKKLRTRGIYNRTKKEHLSFDKSF